MGKNIKLMTSNEFIYVIANILIIIVLGLTLLGWFLLEQYHNFIF